MDSNYQVVGIHGAPRSGTTWLGELFNSSEHVCYRFQPFFSYAFRNRIDGVANAQQLRGFFDALSSSNDEFVTQTGASRIAEAPAPAFKKGAMSHLVYKEVRFHDLIEHFLELDQNARFIGVVRDPRASLDSWRSAPREFDPAWSFEHEWRNATLKNAGLPENWYGFERWKELSAYFLRLRQKYPDRFTILRYEELVANPADALARLFEFCGLSITSQSLDFISTSTSTDDRDPYGVFRQKDAQLNRRLSIPKEIQKEIESELRGTPLATFLYDV